MRFSVYKASVENWPDNRDSLISVGRETLYLILHPRPERRRGRRAADVVEPCPPAEPEAAGEDRLDGDGGNLARDHGVGAHPGGQEGGENFFSNIVTFGMTLPW